MSVENRHFVCEVILPENSPLHSATGRPASRKSTAKRSAAFEACLILLQKKYLDSHLLPTYHKILPRMRNAHLAINSKKTSAYTMKSKPSLWEETRGSYPEKLFVTVLELENPESLGRPCQPLGIMTRTKLPNFPPFLLYLHANKTSNLLCYSISHSYEIDALKLGQLTDFTLRIYKDIYNKTFEVNERQMSYWLAPIFGDWKCYGTEQGAERVVDWTMLEHIQQHPEFAWSVNTPHDQLVNRYLIDRWDGGRRFFSVAVEPTMRPLDPVPEGIPARKWMTSILDYSVSLFSKSRLRATWREDQPVMKVEKVLHRLNWLDELTEKEKKAETTCYLCPEPLRFSAVCIAISYPKSLANALIAAS